MKHILVTGGAGFIGSHTVDLLLEKNYRVIVFDNLSTGKLSNINRTHPNLIFVEGDVLDYAHLKKHIAECDVVLHLAALPSVPKSIENPIESLRINTLGFVNVLQAIREIGKSIRLVYASSAAVYGGDSPLPCSEDAVLSQSALSPYALEKANDERYADLYSRLFGVSSLGLRYFNVYGSRQDPNSPYSGVIAKFIECYQKKNPILIFGDGKQSRDFICVKDVAYANWLAIENQYCGILNIATGTAETLLNLIRYIEKTSVNYVTVQFTDVRPGDILHSYANTLKAQHILNFKSKIPLSEGISQFINMK